MQQWEYKDVHVAATTWTDGTGSRGSLQRFAHEAGHSFWSANQLLNELGSEGWELIGSAAGAADHYVLFFKRPRQ